MQKTKQTTETAVTYEPMLPAVFNLSKYLKSKGFKKLNRNQSHPADCNHKFKFIHPESIIRIVFWEDELMSIGNNPTEFEIPKSEDEFMHKLKEIEPTLLAFLN